MSGRVRTLLVLSAAASSETSLENFSLISRLRTWAVSFSPVASTYWLLTNQTEWSS